MVVVVEVVGGGGGDESGCGSEKTTPAAIPRHVWCAPGRVGRVIMV